MHERRLIPHALPCSVCLPVGEALIKQYTFECVLAVYYTHDKNAAVAKVVTFSDYCQLSLDYTLWPAQSLCNQFDNGFPLWIGDICSTPCYFGSRDPQNPEKCRCHDGYWNTTCGEQCPGGADSLCSGVGPCDKASGQCHCPVNRRGSDSCSVCSPGWIGDDCSVTYTAPTSGQSTVMAKLTDMGQVHNVDGLHFRLTTIGEYHVFEMHPYVRIDAKMIRCHERFACVTFVALRLGDDTRGYATLSMYVTAELKLEFALNGATRVLDDTLYFYGFSVRRISQTEVGVDVSPDMHVIVRAIDRYLHTSVTMPRKLTASTAGLLSGNGTTTVDDAVMYVLNSTGFVGLSLGVCETPPLQSPLSVPVNDSTLPLDTAVVLRGDSVSDSDSLNVATIEKYAQNWKVDRCHRIISYPSLEYELQGSGGYSLKFTGAAAFSNFSSKAVMGGNVSIEVFVNTNSSAGGVIFSFANEHTLTVLTTLNELQLHYNDTVYKSNLTLENNTWNKVVIAYEGATGDTDVYVFGSRGIPLRSILHLPPDVFVDEGLLALGQWQPPRNGRRHDRLPNFVGYLDNFLVWDIRVEATVIKDLWKMKLENAAVKLSAGWQFDEGKHGHAKDMKHGHRLELPGLPWVSPDWVPSFIPDREDSVSRPLAVDCADSTFLEQVEAKCRSVFSSPALTSTCASFNNASVEMYVVFCTQEVCMTDNLDTSYKVVFDLADLCQLSNNTATWPLAAICNESSAAAVMRHGTDCPQKCAFGELSANGTCVCAAGYAGQTCLLVCPGGTDRPCSLHGRCTATGTCECDYNWSGHRCDRCATGWHGTDCSVLLAPIVSSPTARFAFVTPTGTYHTFDDLQFPVDNRAGSFDAFVSTSGDVRVQVHQAICEFGSCVDAVAMATDAANVTVFAQLDDMGWPLIYTDGRKLEMSDMSEQLSANFRLTMRSLHEVVLEVSTPHLVRCNIYIMGQFLQLIIETDDSSCQTARGMLGSCDGNADNDVPFNKTTTNVADIAGRASNASLLPVEQSLFSSSSDDLDLTQLTKAGYSLSFNNTAGTSDPLTYTLTSAATDGARDITISLLVRPTSYGGILFSYANNKTFALSNDYNITIHCGQTSISTATTNTLDAWNQIILAYERNAGRLHFYHFGPNSGLVYETFDVDCPDLMDIGGRLSLGSWQGAPDGVTFELSSFQGQIDELSVWYEQLPHTVIFQAYHLNIKPTAFRRQLSYLYRFTEGVGFTANELMRNSDVRMPYSPWQHPTWEASDLEVTDLPTYHLAQIYTPNEDVALKTVELCDSYFRSAAVQSACGDLSAEVRAHYLSACARSSAQTWNVQHGYYAMMAFTHLCEIAGSGTVDYKSLMCGMSVSTYPEWLTPECTGCMYGSSNGSACLCYVGFWGESCDSVCPGGVGNVCSGHGECQPTGTCACESHFSGAACELSQCDAGWLGADCAVLPSDMSRVSSDDLVAAQLRGQATVTALDGTTFELTKYSVYRVLDVQSKFVVWTRLVPCRTSAGAAKCFDSMMLTYDGEHVFVNSSSSQPDKMVVWTLTQSHDVSSAVAISGIRVTRTTSQSLHLYATDLQATVDVSIKENGVDMTVSTTKALWRQSTGLVSTCNMTLAVQAVACANVDVCSSGADISGCKQPVSKSTVAVFAARSAEASSVYDRFTGGATDSDKVGVCLLFNDNGMNINSLSALPSGSFTLEIQVNPISYGGVVLSYHSDATLSVVNRESGLEIHHGTNVDSTGIVLALDTWSQLNLHWDDEMSVLRVYVVVSYTNTLVHVVRLPSDAFTPGGTLTLGQMAPQAKRLTSTGIPFNGYLDELRVWTRPHNPTVVSQNYRVAVTTGTPNLALYWDFNDGKGTVASELMQSQHMEATSRERPPSWVATDLELTPSAEITTSVFAVSTREDAAKTCKALLQTDERLQGCGGLGIATFNIYLQQCIDDVVVAGNPSAADTAIAQFDALCYKLLNWRPPQNCSDPICCTFGFYDAASQSCSCPLGYWGPTCDNVCMFSTHGACDAHGDCQPTDGTCLCRARWMHVPLPLNQYVTRMALVPYDYACDGCTEGWHGVDCNMAVLGVSMLRYAAVVTGVHLTTFDGLSFEMIQPGAFDMYRVADLSVQMLFLPCPHAYRCRRLVEVSLRTNDFTFAVQISDDDQLAVSVLVKSAWEQVKRDGDGITTYELTGAVVEWRKDNYVRLLFDDGRLEMLVGFVAGELVCGIEVPLDKASASQGMLGNLNGVWSDDVNFGVKNATTHETVAVSDATVIGEVLSTVYVATNMAAKFAVDKSTTHLSHASASLEMSGAGYMLHLDNSYVAFDPLDTTDHLAEFTLSFWVKLQTSAATPAGDNHILTVAFSDGGQLQVNSVDGYWRLSWEHEVAIDIRTTYDAWQRVTITWSATSGQLTLYASGTATNSTVSGGAADVHVGVSVQMTSLTLGARAPFVADLDLLQLWRYSKARSAIVTETETSAYTDVYSRQLLLCALFDDGEGDQTNATVYDTQNATDAATARGLYGHVYPYSSATLRPEEAWLPSSMPLPVDHDAAPEDLPLTVVPDVFDVCKNATDSDLLRQQCGDLGSVQQFYLEACVRSVSAGGRVKEAAQAAQAALVFYCRAVHDADECVFSGYLDLCVARASASTAGPDVPGWAISLIVLLVLAALAALLLCCCRLWLLAGRKRKRKEKEEEDAMMETCLIDARRYPYSKEGGDAEAMSAVEDDDEYEYEGAMRTRVAALWGRVKRPFAKATPPPNSTENTRHAGVTSSPDGRRDSMASSAESYPGRDGTGSGTEVGGLRGRVGSVWARVKSRFSRPPVETASDTWQTGVVTSPDGRRDSRTSTEQSFQVREIRESASRSSVSSLWSRITNPFSSTSARREPQGDTWRSASRTHSIASIELGTLRPSRSSTRVGPMSDDQQPEARLTREPSQPDMIQFDTTDDDASDWPDVPQQPLPARTPSVRSIDANDPVPATLTTPADAKEPGRMRRPVTAKRAMSELRKLTVSPATMEDTTPLEGPVSRTGTIVLDENAQQMNKKPKQAAGGRGAKKGLSTPVVPTRHTGTGSGTPRVNVNRRPPEQPQVAHWGRLSRDSTMTSIGEDDGSLNIRPMSRYDTTPMRSKSRAGSKMSMLSLDSNADRTSNA